MILFINACVRPQSRTRILADHLLAKLDGTVFEENLAEYDFPKINNGFLIYRDALAEQKEYTNPLFSLARRFAKADTIVIAAPFWDLSFPSLLKQYFEQISIPGITFEYSAEGIPVSLCKATSLYYVATAGGFITSEEYGFGYINALAKNFYTIPQTVFIKAEGLDIDGADIDGIMRKAKKDIDRIFDNKSSD